MPLELLCWQKKEVDLIRYLPDIMRTGEDGAPVQEDLDDLVVVGVGGEDERGDVGCEGGRVGGQRLPALKIDKHSLALVVSLKSVNDHEINRASCVEQKYTIFIELRKRAELTHGSPST